MGQPITTKKLNKKIKGRSNKTLPRPLPRERFDGSWKAMAKTPNRTDNSMNFLALGRELQGGYHEEDYHRTAVGPQHQIRLSTLTNQTNLLGLPYYLDDLLGFTLVYLGLLWFTWVLTSAPGCLPRSLPPPPPC